ncbi:MAG: Putative metal chaperone, involved in Zn homeostasis, GTPase of COG0523 family [uncultured Sulfurovum sp.]|uniref:Metal chaperone, involved in Zn homeostasis, GTPase of COG0523 family n=1 Tax=uncultured Sulfurovum sp. TaxID=269237 RepID=A0A6S6STI4_9BACT|nr:MAG: Putative metal chaperone, involved in Zn homeostasis, GTPase of COG0523 family [uncultured Sulfurovum sp.]
MISSFVITGFLGVGKTTMLTNSVKENFGDKKIAIIVNEFGDVGVDSKILKNVHSEVLEISEGCICCQLAEEFESGVREIIEKYNPEIIFVETSGASEPFPIFLSLQNLGISVDGVICVVDSKNFGSYKENSTAKYQLGGSNIIVLNKIDLVTEDEIKALEIELAEIKSEYNIKNTMTGEPIFKSYVTHRAEQGLVGKELFEGIYKQEEVVEFAQDAKHLDHALKDSITQKVAYLKKDINFSDIDEVLKNIPKPIYRVKGVVKVKDVPNAIFVNYSFGDASFEELQDYEDKSLLIFIGENVESHVTDLSNKYSILNVPKFSINKV